MPLEDDLVTRFGWIGGHADIWRWFADAKVFAAIVEALAEPFTTEGVTKVAGIESRGFLLAGGVGRELNAGVIPIRKAGAILPGRWSSKTTTADYRGRPMELLLQQGILAVSDRVLVVDDWLETGSQMLTAVSLINEAGALVVGVAVIVEDSSEDVVRRFPRFHSLIPADALGPSGL